MANKEIKSFRNRRPEARDQRPGERERDMETRYEDRPRPDGEAKQESREDRLLPLSLSPCA